MKIAFLSFYSGSVDRGVETATYALAKHLSKKHDVVVFQAGNRISPTVQTVQIPINNSWPKDTSRSLWRILYLDYYSRKITEFSLKCVPYFLKNTYDVIIPTNGGWQVVIMRVITWLFGKKMIIQGNAGIGRDDYWNLLTFPNRFIAISPQGLSWAHKKAPWIKTVYIPYGVDTKTFESAQPLPVTLKKPIVLCVAAFQPFKRIDLLIKAMEQVSNASLLIIGNGIEEKKLQHLGSRLLGKRFLLKTGVTYDILPRYYKVASVFSLPSSSTEALGIVQIEAMAAGMPVVATKDLNRREILGDAGVLVDPTNIQAYAKALEHALHTDYGNLPQKQAAQYRWDAIVQQYNKLLEKL